MLVSHRDPDKAMPGHRDPDKAMLVSHRDPECWSVAGTQTRQCLVTGTQTRPTLACSTGHDRQCLCAQVLTVAVPVLTTDSLTWSCSGEAPARQCLVTRGLMPMLSEGSARATDADTTDDILLVGGSSTSTV